MAKRIRIPPGHPTLFDDGFEEGVTDSENEAPDDEAALDPTHWDPFAGVVHPSLLERRIVHVDMDAFYASIEERDNPEYRGKPLVVGGDPQSRGVVATCNYVARTFGIRSAVSCAHAHRLCPDALFVRPRFDRYVEVSRQVRGIFLSHTPLVEPLSLDEAYLDVTAICAREGIPAVRIAERVRAEIFAQTRLTASAGVAPNKMVAKIASDVRKPDGLYFVRPEKVFTFMRGLPIRRIPFVGPRTEERLASRGFAVCEDLVRAGAATLSEVVGSWGPGLWWRAQGIDLGQVSASRERKSCGEEQTFSRDLRTREEMHAELGRIAASLWTYLSSKGFSGRTFTLKVKYHDFRSVTRRVTHPDLIRGEDTLFSLACELLARTEAETTPVRLLGLSLSTLAPLVPGAHMDLGEDDEPPGDGGFG